MAQMQLSESTVKEFYVEKPFVVDAGNMESWNGSYEKNSKYSEGFATLHEAMASARTCGVYDYVEINYVGPDGKVWEVKVDPVESR